MNNNKNKTQINATPIDATSFTFCHNGYTLSAADLLYRLTLLITSQLDVFIDDKNVSQYLISLGLVSEIKENRFKLIPEKRSECVALGNQISRDITRGLNEIPMASSNMKILYSAPGAKKA